MLKNLDQILTKVSYFYLALPFFVFTITWLSIPFAFIFGILTIVSLFLSFKNIINSQEVSQQITKNRRAILIGIFFSIIIMFFSGIGNFSFQNHDHLYRNAIFRDLVLKEWPVLYKIDGFENHFLNGKTTMMTYYMGFFLVPAYFGKLFGIQFGQYFLFIWSILGLLLIIFQLGKYFKRFNLNLFILFFSWGTLFFIGEVYKYSFLDIFQEKEALWAGMVLYADSNLGLIYWTYNQTLTAWLIILLIFNNESKRNILFLFSLCIFLSPFSSVGLLPFLGYHFCRYFTGSFKSIKNWGNNISKYLSFQNTICSALITGLSYFYLSSNPASKILNVLHHRPFIFIAFLLLSWGIITILIYGKYKKDPLFWLIIAILIPLPFFQLSYGIDFPGRLSIPAMFILMLLVGSYIIEEKNGIIKKVIFIYLLMTGLWHLLFETGRSIYYTAKQTISHQTTIGQNLAKSDNKFIAKFGEDLLEIRNQNILIKDLSTLSDRKNEVITHYMANIENNKFYKYLARKNTPK